LRYIAFFLFLAYWPLMKNNGVTGSFSEYRFNHIHSGFDLSTRGETGYPLKCFGNGYVFMIKVKKRGYGNVVYIKHPDKRLISVYAHLKRFNDKIQAVVERYKKKRKTRYPGLIVLEKGKIRVKKGEIIGYSGESGEGLPHLHFELRDYNNNPVDASLYGFDMRFDNSYPVIVSLKAMPQDAFSWVNGRCEQVDLKVKKKSKTLYTFEPFTVCGNVRFALNTYDRAGRGKIGVKEIVFYLNDKTVYHFLPDTFSFDSFKQSCCVFDFESTSLSPTMYYYNLFKVKGCTLPISSGVENYPFKEGENRVSILVRDFHNNEVVLKGRFYYKKEPLKEMPDFTPLTVVKDGRVIFADKLNSLIEFENYAVFPYDGIKREYNYRTIHIEIEGLSTEKRLLKIEKTGYKRGFLKPVEGTFYRVSRENEFVKRIVYAFKLKKADKTYGVYYYDRFKKRWKFIGDDIKVVDKSVFLSASYYRAGKVGVFIDNEKPSVSSKGFYFDEKTVIPAGDMGKGIDEQYSFLKSGEKVFKLEYDPDRKWLFYYKKLKEGLYTAHISDLAGNSIEKRVYISKKRSR